MAGSQKRSLKEQRFSKTLTNLSSFPLVSGLIFHYSWRELGSWFVSSLFQLKRFFKKCIFSLHLFQEQILLLSIFQGRMWCEFFTLCVSLDLLQKFHAEASVPFSPIQFLRSNNTERGAHLPAKRPFWIYMHGIDVCCWWWAKKDEMIMSQTVQRIVNSERKLEGSYPMTYAYWGFPFRPAKVWARIFPSNYSYLSKF